MQNSIYQSVWNAGECAGPPSVMYIYSENATLLNYYPIQDISTKCGYSPIELNVGCCAVSINTQLTNGYQSLSIHSLSSKYTLGNSAPQSANGASYCNLISLADGSLFGKNAIYYLNSGQCLDSHFECSDTLKYYVNSNCTGNITDLPFGQQYHIAGLGNFSTSYLTVSNGEIVYSWTTYIGGTYLLNEFSIPMEVLCMFSYFFSLMAFLMIAIKQLKRYHQTGRLSYVLFSFTTFTWAISVLIKIIDSYVRITNSAFLVAMAIFSACTLIPSLLTALISIFIFCEVWKFSRYTCATQMGITILVFAVLLGQAYYDIAVSYAGLELVDIADYDSPIRKFIWGLFSLSLDMIPSLSMCYLVLHFNKIETLKCGRTYSLWKEILFPSKKLLFFGYAQFWNYMIFVAIIIIRQATLILGDDKNFKAVEGIITLLYLIHNSLLFDLIEEFRNYKFEYSTNSYWVNRRIQNFSRTTVSVIDPMSPTLSIFRPKLTQTHSVDSNISKQQERAKFSLSKSGTSEDSRFPRHPSTYVSSNFCSPPDSIYPIELVATDRLSSIKESTPLPERDITIKEKGKADSLESFKSESPKQSPVDLDMLDNLSHKLNNVIGTVEEEDWRD